MASAHLEAGQGFWLAKQRWLWRRGRLAREQFLMLQLAGLEMDIDPPLQWKRLAHEAAHYLHGSQIHPDQVHIPPSLPGFHIHLDQVVQKAKSHVRRTMLAVAQTS